MESGDIITSKTEEENESILNKAQQKKLFLEKELEICTELKSRPTLFLGVELKDPDFIDMLDFIMKKAGKIEQPMYIVSSTSVIDSKVSEVINRYNLKLTVFDEVEFLDGVKNLLQKEDSDQVEKKLVR